MNWQRTNVQAAASYMAERIAFGATDARTQMIYQGLLEVLDPARREMRIRLQRTVAHVEAGQGRRVERRSMPDRRRGTDRRKVNLGSPTGVERRGGRDRRTVADRRALEERRGAEERQAQEDDLREGQAPTLSGRPSVEGQ